MLGKQTALNTILALLILLATVATPAILASSPATAQDDITTIDANHPLTTQASIDEFEQEDSTSATLAYPQAEITIAKGADGVNLQGDYLAQYSNDYVRIDYNEDVPRTMRIYIPREYAGTYVNTDVEPANDVEDVEASYDVTDDGQYLAVTLTVNSETDVILPIDEKNSFSFGFWDRKTDAVDNATDIVSGEWTQVDSAALSGSNSTTTVDTTGMDNPVFQYQVGEDEWAPLPEEQSNSAPLFRFQKPGVDNTVYIVSETSDPPAVRYQDGGAGGTAKTVAQDIGNIVNKFTEDISGLFDGIL